MELLERDGYPNTAVLPMTIGQAKKILQGKMKNGRP
jgi:hypothetical protein